MKNHPLFEQKPDKGSIHINPHFDTWLGIYIYTYIYIYIYIFIYILIYGYDTYILIYGYEREREIYIYIYINWMIFLQIFPFFRNFPWNLQNSPPPGHMGAGGVGGTRPSRPSRPWAPFAGAKSAKQGRWQSQASEEDGKMVVKP